VPRNRLTRITTRTGDRGESGLADGSRRAKTDPVFTALGDIDELNSVLGVAISEIADDTTKAHLRSVQSRLFDLGGAIATPGTPSRFDDDVATLDTLVTTENAKLEPLRNFVLPGGTRAAAALHHARAVCRRAERSCWALHAAEPFADTGGIVYLNRLSDLLFVLARLANAAVGHAETLWQPRSE
jgi:cob(I)alamin adenosyltransferase